PAYAAARGDVALDRTSAERTPAGHPAGCADAPADAGWGAPRDEIDADAASTTHLSVVDGEGNAVAYTATLGTPFGAALMRPALYDARPALVAALRAMGHGVLRAGGARGAAQVVAVDPAGGQAYGAADRRRDGAVARCPA